MFDSLRRISRPEDLANTSADAVLIATDYPAMSEEDLVRLGIVPVDVNDSPFSRPLMGKLGGHRLLLFDIESLRFQSPNLVSTFEPSLTTAWESSAEEERGLPAVFTEKLLSNPLWETKSKFLYHLTQRHKNIATHLASMMSNMEDPQSFSDWSWEEENGAIFASIRIDESWSANGDTLRAVGAFRIVGRATINPDTGLPEFGGWTCAFRADNPIQRNNYFYHHPHARATDQGSTFATYCLGDASNTFWLLCKILDFRGAAEIAKSTFRNIGTPVRTNIENYTGRG